MSSAVGNYANLAGRRQRVIKKNIKIGKNGKNSWKKDIFCVLLNFLEFSSFPQKNSVVFLMKPYVYSTLLPPLLPAQLERQTHIHTQPFG